MAQIFIKGIAIAALFFGSWFALSQVSWTQLLHIEQMTARTEQKLGELFWDVFRQSDEAVQTTVVVAPIDTIVSRICAANRVNRQHIKLHILEKREVNAFALPDGHLVVYTGLIRQVNSPEALAGVLAHELAHIQNDHVMKKLGREVGLSVLIGAASGSGSPQIIREAARHLSGTAFDRGLEREADIEAVTYLSRAAIDPEPFADFLFQLSEKEQGTPDYLSWISTHPASKERARYIREKASQLHRSFSPAVDAQTWARMKEAL